MKHYSKLFIVITLAVSFWSCNNDLDNDLNDQKEVIEDLTNLTISRERNLEDAVYHEQSMMWIIPQNDPYALENFQKAYDNLASGNTSQRLTRSLSNEFVENKKLMPTHYAVKFYPENLEQLYELEAMEDISLSPMPYNYVPLQEDEIKKAENKYSIWPLFPEKHLYKIKYNEYDETDTTSYIMPIMYAVWPAGKEYPNINHNIDYNVFLPNHLNRIRSLSLSDEALKMLEGEAAALAYGNLNKAELITRSLNAMQNFSGTLTVFDTYENKYMPLPKLKVQIYSGAQMLETVTDERGRFYISGDIPTNPKIRIIYDNAYWSITNQNFATALVNELGSANQFLGTNYKHYGFPNTNLAAVCLRPVNYYFYYNTIIPKITRKLRLAASTVATGDSGGFNWSSSNPYIIMSPTEMGNTLWKTATVFHELGHFTHWTLRGSKYSKYNEVHQAIRESFGPYCGWKLSAAFHGTTWPATKADPTGNAFQDWEKTSSSPYTPLFIDLQDHFNNKDFSPYFNTPDERITNFPTSTIIEIITNCTKWAGANQVKERIKAAGTVLYRNDPAGLANLNSYLGHFDYYFERN